MLRQDIQILTLHLASYHGFCSLHTCSSCSSSAIAGSTELESAEHLPNFSIGSVQGGGARRDPQSQLHWNVSSCTHTIICIYYHSNSCIFVYLII